MALNTSCNFCVFRVNNEDGVQTGCKFGRLTAFQMRGEATKDTENSFYTISRFCNYCRNEQSFTSTEKLLEETKARFSILLTLDELKRQPSLSYKWCELFIVVKTGTEYKEAKELVQTIGVKYKINISDDPRHTVSKLRHHVNTYLVIGNVEDRHLLEVDYLVNTVMEKIIAYDTPNTKIILKSLFTIHCAGRAELVNEPLIDLYNSLVQTIKDENENEEWRRFIWSKTSDNDNSAL